MDTVAKKRVYTKTRLVKELAFKAGISQNQSRAVLETLLDIAYREARNNFFILPGLCKFDVVRRSARNVRNPVTGEMLVLPERDALRVSLAKRAKEAVVPHVAAMKLEDYKALCAAKAAEEEAARKAAAEAAAAEEAARKAAEEEAARKAAEEAARKAAEEEAARKAAEEAARQAAEEARKAAQSVITAPEALAEAKPSEDGFIEVAEGSGENAISFKCHTCGQEIIVPGEAVGYEAECPTCGAILTVPSKSEPGTSCAKGDDAPAEQKEVISSEEAEDMNPEVLKNRTIRIDAMLFDDETQQATDSAVVSAQKSRTMRIDLPDDF